jgi:DNA-binding GntR family transcriptional regulator
VAWRSSVAESLGDADASRDDGETLALMAYRRLKNLIVSGSLFPGTPLKESEISERLGISRTPVREAFRMLRSEGLVQLTVNRGAHVAQISRTEVANAYEAREWLESAMTGRAAERATDELIRTLREVIDRTPDQPLTHEEALTAAQADTDFHEIVLIAADNAVALDFARRARAITHRAAFFVVPMRYHSSKQEHIEILSALEHRNPRAAEESMRRHIATARLRIDQFGEEHS